MLRYWTAGESHGPALVALVDGFPAGLTVDTAAIDAELVRRQGGYGRGGGVASRHGIAAATCGFNART